MVKQTSRHLAGTSLEPTHQPSIGTSLKHARAPQTSRYGLQVGAVVQAVLKTINATWKKEKEQCTNPHEGVHIDTWYGKKAAEAQQIDISIVPRHGLSQSSALLVPAVNYGATPPRGWHAEVGSVLTTPAGGQRDSVQFRVVNKEMQDANRHLMMGDYKNARACADLAIEILGQPSLELEARQSKKPANQKISEADIRYDIRNVQNFKIKLRTAVDEAEKPAPLVRKEDN